MSDVRERHLFFAINFDRNIGIHAMSTQQYIDYLQEVKAGNLATISTNEATITGIDDAISALNGQITSLTSQKTDIENANTDLTADNTLIDSLISFIESA
jgi:hypothetical protein